MKRPDDVVDAVLIDGDSRMAALNDQLDDIGDLALDARINGVGSRHHDLSGDGVPEGEDALDHLPFVFGDQPSLLSLINQLLDFFFNILGVLEPASRRKHILSQC